MSWWCVWWRRTPTSSSAGDEVPISGGLGTQMMVWEFAIAVAGRLLGINPFDQPDVEAAKKAARGLLDARPEATPANFVDGAVEVRGPRLAGRVPHAPRRGAGPLRPAR